MYFGAAHTKSMIVVTSERKFWIGKNDKGNLHFNLTYVNKINNINEAKMKNINMLI